LANEYKNKSEIGLFLRICFGLPFLPPEMVSNVFAYEIIPIIPAKCLEFTDYILDNYISENAQFPPSMWAQCSSSVQRTTNACEAFHSKFNSSFYSSHPNIHQFINVLKSFQINTYVLMNSINTPKKDYRRKKYQKIDYLNEEIKKFKQKTNSAFIYLKNVSLKFQPTLF